MKPNQEMWILARGVSSLIAILLVIDICDAYWSPWSSWSTCSKTCGRGRSTRYRCDEVSGDCSTDENQFKICYVKMVCPIDTTNTLFSRAHEDVQLEEDFDYRLVADSTYSERGGSRNCFNPADENSYRGRVSRTRSGYKCQKWNRQRPWPHKFKPKLYEWAALTKNYCRNPNKRNRPWCFTTNKGKEWEFCDVPTCEETTTAATTAVSLTTIATPICGNPAIPMSRLKPGVKGAIPEHIVGGRETVHGSIPWQASIRTRQGIHFCGGSLISPRWIVTAAHCILSPNKPNKYIAVLGEGNRRKVEGSEKVAKFDFIRNHQRYDSYTLDNDISLMRMTSEIKFTTYIIPICLPEFNSRPSHNDVTIVSGWGATQNVTESTDVLRQTSVPVWDNCEDIIRDVNPATMLCAGYLEGGKDSCQGDSGGPLFGEKAANVYELIGIVSWGYGCARPNRPGVYTRVSRYVSWINSITGRMI